jgi:hypothetical protein
VTRKALIILPIDNDLSAASQEERSEIWKIIQTTLHIAPQEDPYSGTMDETALDWR